MRYIVASNYKLLKRKVESLRWVVMYPQQDIYADGDGELVKIVSRIEQLKGLRTNVIYIPREVYSYGVYQFDDFTDELVIMSSKGTRIIII